MYFICFIWVFFVVIVIVIISISNTPAGRSIVESVNSHAYDHGHEELLIFIATSCTYRVSY